MPQPRQESLVLLKNLFQRMRLVKTETAWELKGLITKREYTALEDAFQTLKKVDYHEGRGKDEEDN